METFLRLHDDPDAFRDALRHTEAEYGFSQRLIEKDYYCSLILADFEALFSCGLVFKGGTCLSKVHGGFFRLSEDLDFAISISTEVRRSDRRRAIAPVKAHLEQIAERLPEVGIVRPLKGENECRQYNALLDYASLATGEHETVKIQIALREPIVEPTIVCAGRTLLRVPLPEAEPAPELSLRVMSLREMYAEKVRAALTRTPPAIRDVFDIDEAARANRLNLFEPGFLSLVRQNLAVPGNATIHSSETRRNSLVTQLESSLKSVLRSVDYAEFNIDRAIGEVERLAALVRTD